MPALNVLFCLLLLVAGQATATVPYVPRMERVATCSWDRPGHNPFMGDVVAAVDRYTDIPTAVRVRLKQRMQARQYDDFVDIRRDSISGKETYEPTIRDMHFGLDRVCRQVTRERWSAQMHERGVVYCEQGHCLLVPTVCRNVSRISRRPTLVAGETSQPGGPQEAAGAPTTRGPGDASSERSAATGAAAPDSTRGPVITSSFAEAVAGATLPLWPIGSADGAAPGDPSNAGNEGPGGPGAGPPPWWSAPDGGGSPWAPGVPGGSGGVGDGIGGTDPGAGSGSGGGGAPKDGGSGGSGGGPGDGGFPGGGGLPGGGDLPGGGIGAAPPVSAIPEPATWASLLLGLAVLALVSARRRRPG